MVDELSTVLYRMELPVDLDGVVSSGGPVLCGYRVRQNIRCAVSLKSKASVLETNYVMGIIL